MWKYYVNLFIYRCYFHEHFHYILFRQSNSQQIWHDSSLPMNTDCCAGKSLSKLLSQQSINKRNWRLWQSAVAACQTTSNSGYRDGHVASRTKDSFGILWLDTARSISDKPIAATVAGVATWPAAPWLHRARFPVGLGKPMPLYWVSFTASIEKSRLRRVAMLSTLASDLETERSSTDSVIWLHVTTNPWRSR